MTQTQDCSVPLGPDYRSFTLHEPFGGTRNSGFDREKGLAALASYYQVKCVNARI